MVECCSDEDGGGEDSGDEDSIDEDGVVNAPLGTLGAERMGVIRRIRPLDRNGSTPG